MRRKSTKKRIARTGETNLNNNNNKHSEYKIWKKRNRKG